MMVKRSVILLLMLMVVLAGSVRAEDAKELVVASAKELKGIKAKKITWKKDGAKVVRIPEVILKEKDTYDEFGDLVPGKVFKVADAFYMEWC